MPRTASRRSRQPSCIASILVSVLLLLASTTVLAQRRDYRIDPDHSRILFRVAHMGLSHTLGSFSGLDGQFSFDDAYWDSAKVSVDIPLASLNLSDDDWQRKVLDDYLQADKHPVAHFEADSLHVDADDDDVSSGTLHGQLTLNSITRDVVLQVRYNGSKRNIYTKLKRKVGFSATGTFQRSAFGLDKQLDVVGDEIEIEIEIEGIAKRSR